MDKLRTIVHCKFAAKHLKIYYFFLTYRSLDWNTEEQQNYIYLNDLYFKYSDFNTMSDVTKNMFCFSRKD